MKKGFTLVELLAVIVIIGILVVIIIPKITDALNDAEKNTNMTSAQNLIRAASLKAANNDIVGIQQSIKINYTTGENQNYLDYTGEKPENGQVNIKANGEVAMAVKFGEYCYLKSYNSNDIKVIPYSEDTCGENAEVFTNYTRPELAISGDGLYESVTEPGRYIYRGAKPNNYIWLDEDGDGTKLPTELYRIISYEKDGTIKVIRDASIGTNAWDTDGTRNNSNNSYCTSNGCNVWATQETTYYNDAPLVNLNPNFFYKYYPSNTAKELQDFINTGTVTQNASLNEYLNHLIQNKKYWAPAEILDKYISGHSFNVGGLYYTSSYTGGDKGLSKEKEEQNIYTWNGKIGLMNITEYVESSLNPSCTSVYSNYRANTLYYYDDNGDDEKDYHTPVGGWPCTNQGYNWMAKGITEWSLAPNSSTRNNVWYVNSTGFFNNNYGATNAFGVRPAFYLKSSIKLGGLGTSDDPYYIMD